MKCIRLLVFMFVCLSIALPGATAGAHVRSAHALQTPLQASEAVRTTLFQAQLSLDGDKPSARTDLDMAEATYASQLGPFLSEASPEAHRRAVSGFEMLHAAIDTDRPALFAAGRARVWTAILAGSFLQVEAALRGGDLPVARSWLTVREYRTATRFSTPSANATLALGDLAAGDTDLEGALQSVRADLYDVYQSRLNECLRDLSAARGNGFGVRASELAALAEGYFSILAPAYAGQRGREASENGREAFAALRAAAIAGGDLNVLLDDVQTRLDGFRAAPLSPADQARRAGQLLRFISLVPVEYQRGVSGGRVVHDFEIQEAISFHAAAYAAFADLEPVLREADAAGVEHAKALFERLGGQLAGAGLGQAASDPQALRSDAESLSTTLGAMMPEAWLQAGAQADFDVIASMLTQVEGAVRSGDYALAESSRLEAYAILESGPEARLIALAPGLTGELEDLFWNGQGRQKGLAYLIRSQAGLEEIRATLAALASLLSEVEQLVGGASAPAAIAMNAGIIVFREGLEAVVILASLMSSMRSVQERKYRTPMWWGVVAAAGATMLTWLLARGVIQSLAQYGEKLEAIVSLIALCVLLVIMNWFFHKLYWTSWITQFHQRKRRLLSGEAGLLAGLGVLGFTSVYREGFEVVLFLQALILDAGVRVVLLGALAGLALVLLVGLVAFKVQVVLPYKKMLVITGILIGVVLLQIVGKTVYAFQLVGWMPVHPLEGISIPFWLGAWFGVYATWEGFILQILAAGFVIGSYYLAEWTRKRSRVQKMVYSSDTYPPTA